MEACGIGCSRTRATRQVTEVWWHEGKRQYMLENPRERFEREMEARRLARLEQARAEQEEAERLKRLEEEAARQDAEMERRREEERQLAEAAAVREILLLQLCSVSLQESES